MSPKQERIADRIAEIDGKTQSIKSLMQLAANNNEHAFSYLSKIDVSFTELRQIILLAAMDGVIKPMQLIGMINAINCATSHIMDVQSGAIFNQKPEFALEIDRNGTIQRTLVTLRKFFMLD